jgi:hypothetical protein
MDYLRFQRVIIIDRNVFDLYKELKIEKKYDNKGSMIKGRAFLGIGI